MTGSVGEREVRTRGWTHVEQEQEDERESVRLVSPSDVPTETVRRDPAWEQQRPSHVYARQGGEGQNATAEKVNPRGGGEREWTYRRGRRS